MASENKHWRLFWIFFASAMHKFLPCTTFLDLFFIFNPFLGSRLFLLLFVLAELASKEVGIPHGPAKFA